VLELPGLAHSNEGNMNHQPNPDPAFKEALFALVLFIAVIAKLLS
jgi:hypothetical protein